jgi:glutathione S-transferase
MGVRVGKARKAHGVTYPAMSGPDAFNCVVRGHLNTLENQPAALTLLLLAALFKPCGSAMAGAVWVVGRVVYFLGYSSGRPAARAKGAFNHFGQLAQMWIVVAGAVKLLRA